MSDIHQLGPLLDRVLAGDMQALEVLLVQIRPYLHLLVRQQLEPDRRHRLEDSDLVQETLVRIHGGLNPAAPPAASFQGRTPPEFLAWISQILRHVIVDQQRHGKAQKRDTAKEIAGSKLLATLVQGSGPEQAGARAERATHVAAALGRLPDRQRDVVQWRVFEQLSYDEISQRTGASQGALRVVFTRAIAALRSDEDLRRLMESAS